jgi:hypothetical protein
VNPERGWKILIHHLSHWIHWLRYGRKLPPHAPAHARLELAMVRQVVKRGWLEGKLAPRKATTREKADKATTRMEHAIRMLRRAETRSKRAETIRKKWAKRVQRLARQMPS